MNLQNLLGSSFDCRCGRQHQIPVREFIYEEKAVSKLPEIIKRISANSACNKITVVFDIRTKKICGLEAAEVLSAKGFKVAEITVPDKNEHSPACDDITCQWLKDKISENKPDIIIAVGSGTINDLCKWSSFDLGLPYIVIATAASMNGYAAMNVAAKIKGLKVILKAKPPLAVIAEPKIIEDAPLEMTAAGFGDTIAKSQSNADWLLNNYLFDEYLCKYCIEMLGSLESSYLNLAEKLKSADRDAVKAIFEALFWTGIAMTMVGTSIPASGGEHMLSHTLDMISDVRGQKHNLHGAQVAIGTIVSAVLYEKLLKMETPVFCDIPADIDYSWWSDKTVAKSVSEQYQLKKPQLEIARNKLSQKHIWNKLRDKLRPVVRSPREIKGYLSKAGAVCSIKDLGVSREHIKELMLHMHEIRKRVTIVDIAWLTGILPNFTDEIIDEWLVD